MMRRYICPYGDDDREILPVRTIEVPKVILTCDSVGADIAPEVFVSRGSLLGYKNEIPVYASIDGIIAHIAKRKESYRKSVYDITVRRCAHGRMLWSEVPFFKYAGAAYFLRQLGISVGVVNAAHMRQEAAAFLWRKQRKLFSARQCSVAVWALKKLYFI